MKYHIVALPSGMELFLYGMPVKGNDVQWLRKVFRPFTVALQIVARRILFVSVILEMCLVLDWSPPVANLIDGTHLCI